MKNRPVSGRRRRNIGGLVLALIAGIAAISSLGASVRYASAAECPNESIREEQQGAISLPDCMAYEMVSPREKENQGATTPSFSADGERVIFRSRDALGGTTNLVDALHGDVYVATRTSGGWQTGPTTAPGASGFGYSGAQSGLGNADGFSPNFDRWFSRQVIAGGFQSGSMTAFEGGLGGLFSPRSPLLIPVNPEAAQFQTVTQSYFQGATPDLSRLYLTPGTGGISTRPVYLPDDPRPASTAAANTYVLLRGPAAEPEIQLLARDSAGTVWGGTCGAWIGGGSNPLGKGGRNQGAISPTGSRVYFSTRPAQPQPEAAHPDLPVCGPTENPIRILERTEGPGGVQISELLPGGPAPMEGSDFFEGASADGSKVYFTTNRPLAATDTDSGPECVFGSGVEGCDLYLYDSDRPAGDRVVQVSAGEASADHPVVGAGAKVDAGVTAISGDGSRVYFVAEGALSAAANPEGDAPVAPAEGTGTPSYASGFATTVANSDQVTVTFVSQGTFEVGQSITAANIPSGTTITAVAGNTVTLSAAATASGTFASISAAAKRITGVSATSGEFVAGQMITGPGIPARTTITSVGPGALEISSAPTAGGVTPLSAGAPNLYVFDARTDRLAFIGTLAPEDANPGQLFGAGASFTGEAQAVPLLAGGPGDESGGDGHVFVFRSKASLTSNDADGGYADIFRYDSTAHRLECLSCAPTGEPDSAPINVTAPSSSETASFRVQSDFAERTRWASEDGSSVVFATTEDLLPDDSGELTDSYLWRNGTLTLLPGDATQPVIAHDASEVAFRTARRLLPEDGDTAPDIYLARSGGGFATPLPGAVCVASACQGQPSPAPDAQTPSSASYSGAGNVREQKSRHKRHRHKKHAAHHRRHKHKHRSKCRGARHRGRICVKKRTGKSGGATSRGDDQTRRAVTRGGQD